MPTPSRQKPGSSRESLAFITALTCIRDSMTSKQERLARLVAQLGLRKDLLLECRGKRLRELQGLLFQEGNLKPEAEKLVTPTLVLECLWVSPTQTLALFSPPVDCANLLLAVLLRRKLLDSGVLGPGDDLMSVMTDDSTFSILYNLLNRAVGHDANSPQPPPVTYLAMFQFRPRQMLTYLVLALLGEKETLQSIYRSGQFRIPSCDWTMLLAIAGDENGLFAFPQHTSSGHLIAFLFPYFVTLAEAFGRNLDTSLTIYKDKFLLPCSTLLYFASLHNLVCRVVEFVKSCDHGEQKRGLVSSKPHMLYKNAALIFDVNVVPTWEAHTIHTFPSEEFCDLMVLPCRSSLPRSLRLLCLEVFKDLCHAGAAGWFLLALQDRLRSIPTSALERLVLFLVQCLDVTDVRNPISSPCQLCHQPVTSFVLSLLQQKNVPDGVYPEEIAGYIDIEELRLLSPHRRLCSYHDAKFPAWADLDREVKACVDLRGVPSLKVCAVKTVLQSLGGDVDNLKEMNIPGHLAKYFYLDTIDWLKDNPCDSPS